MRKLLALATLVTGVAHIQLPVHATPRCGLTSHYGVGDGYAWQTMANGRPMDPGANITAHRSLPLGSRIRVTNPGNGRSVVVTVTDRGPYHGNRILDLSHGAFSRIASPSSGVASVCYTRLS
jgi:rare lipoprotein A